MRRKTLVKPCRHCGQYHPEAYHIAVKSEIETLITPARQAKAAEEAASYLRKFPQDRSLIEAGLRKFFQVELPPDEVPF